MDIAEAYNLLVNVTADIPMTRTGHERVYAALITVRRALFQEQHQLTEKLFHEMTDVSAQDGVA